MPFFDQVLKQQVQYQINVDNSAGGKTAITILKINRRDRLAAAEQLSVAPGARTTLTDTAAGNINRVIMQVHPNPGGVCSVEIKSNANWLFANHAVQKIDSREVRPSGLVPQSGRIVGLGEKTSFGRRPMKHSRAFNGKSQTCPQPIMTISRCQVESGSRSTVRSPAAGPAVDHRGSRHAVHVARARRLSSCRDQRH